MATLADARSVEAMVSVVAVIHELKHLLGSRASDAEAVRDHHSCGESYHPHNRMNPGKMVQP